MQSQCVIESEINFTHLMTFRLSDINIHHRRVDGINRNLYFTISIRTYSILNPCKYSQHIHDAQNFTNTLLLWHMSMCNHFNTLPGS